MRDLRALHHAADLRERLGERGLRRIARQQPSPTRGSIFRFEVTNVRKFTQYFRRDHGVEPRRDIGKYSELSEPEWPQSTEAYGRSEARERPRRSERNAYE